MRVTPLDIRKQEFRKTMRGLDADEVYAFLNTIAEEYEIVLSDNKRLREHIVELEERIKEYRGLEQNLRNTLLTAERVTAEAKENARREAGLIVREAEVEAERAAEAIRAHTQQLRKEILDLKRQKDNYLTRFKTLIESHRKMLEGFEEDFSHVDEEIERIGKQVEEDVSRGAPSQRMSRERITEDFAHGPTDKVTWGDEQKREDEERPTIPKPERHEGREPGRDVSKPEDAWDAAPHADSVAPPEDRETVGHIDTEPVGAMDDMTTAQAQNEMQEELFGAEETPPGPAAEPEESGEDWKTNEARQHVAQKIEEKLYPDIHINGGTVDEVEPLQAPAAAPAVDVPAAPGDRAEGAASGATPEPVQQPGAEGVTEAVPEQTQPEAGTAKQAAPTERQVEEVPEVPQAQDDWKAYEVREEKQDWSGYDVPRPDAEQQQAKGTKADKEVEEALSGLTEMSEGSDTGEHKRAVDPQVPKKAPPNGSPDDSTSTQGGVEQPPKPPRTDHDVESTWSMEQLRRNLTNLDQDEGN